MRNTKKINITSTKELNFEKGDIIVITIYYSHLLYDI